MKIKKIFFILLFSSIVCILTNGNAKMTEYWDINMYDTNTLFKSFKKDSKFKEITEVSVKELNEDQVPITIFENSGEYKYHEDKNFFHATDDGEGNFEIAWGVSADGFESRYFEISYIIKDCINVYDDCAELYWKVIGEEWQMETDYVTGTVTLPKDVDEYDDFRVWAHGPLTGTIIKEDNKTCSFAVEKMPTKTFLELRIAFPKEIVPNARNVQNKNMLDTILEEEQKNADRANMKRKFAQNREQIFAAAISVITGLFGISAFSRLKDIDKNNRDANRLQEEYNYDYYRDIPDDKMSPVTAAVLENGTISHKNAFSSLMMSLTQKKWVSITPGEKKDDTIIKLNIAL